MTGEAKIVLLLIIISLFCLPLFAGNESAVAKVNSLIDRKLDVATMIEINRNVQLLSSGERLQIYEDRYITE